jgi:Collagen triple helix repeat (20 copies)/Chaperone of endosialidase
MAYNKPTANQISLGSSTNLDQVINPSGVWIGSPTGLQGPTGAQGVQGTTGSQGTQGVQGRQGTTGIQGSTGTQGVQGTTGAQGVQGTQGVQGPGGLTTTDATTLDSLDSTDFERRYATSNTGMTAGWYTIAANFGSRAFGQFTLIDQTSSAHQSVSFEAGHHYGGGNGITVKHNGAFSISPFRYIRIMEGGTYDGAMLQVYVDSTMSGTGLVAMTANNQIAGWVVKSFIPAASDPGTVNVFSSLTNTAANVDLDLNGAGSNILITTGNVYAGGDTTQYQVIHKGCTAEPLQLGSLGVGTAASGTTGEIRATNNITAYYSDMRLKDKIYNIPGALSKVMSLSGFYFTPNQVAQDFGYEYKREVGVSAQEVEAVLPEAVAPAPISDEYLTVRYEKLVPLLIEAIKELKQELDELKAKVQ